MWRSVLAAVLIPAMGSAQSAPMQTVPQSPAASTVQSQLQKSQRPNPAYLQYTFYNVLRRGTSEEVAVVPSGIGLVTTPKSPTLGIVPIRLELEPTEGLSVSAIHYPKSFPRKVKFQVDPLPAAPAQIQFKLHAGRNVALGVHTLRGKLTFQPIPYEGSAPGPVQELNVEMPITVVEHNAHVNRPLWPFSHTPVALLVVIIVLSPVLIPIVLLYYLLCAIEGSRNCD